MALAYLRRQYQTAWSLLDHHLATLTTDECLWRPADAGLHVHPTAAGWQADWPTHEGYDLGPSSIGWLTWHLVFWWSMVIDHSFGDGQLAREDVAWPGSADALRDQVGVLHARWTTQLDALTDDDIASPTRTRWPFPDRPFGDVIAWANVELTKSAAEIGYARFLHARRGLP